MLTRDDALRRHDDIKIGQTITGYSKTGDMFFGEVFSVDRSSALLVLRTQGDIQNSHHVQILSLEGIEITQCLELKTSAVSTNDAKLPVIDKQRQERRFESAMKMAQFASDNIGENVSAEAQEIFDALARTLPCRWKEQVIVVLEEVTIAPPYVEPKGGDDLFRDRIKNVLVHERRRLGI